MNKKTIDGTITGSMAVAQAIDGGNATVNLIIENITINIYCNDDLKNGKVAQNTPLSTSKENKHGTDSK